MAVTNGWGRGIDNSIGWGLGAFNNSISWGEAYEESWAGQTQIYSPIAGEAWELIGQVWQSWNTNWNS